MRIGVAVALCCTAAAAGMPDRAAGTFVQRKTLADVGVTLVSRGDFAFARGRAFTWRTVEPLATTFHATPTNYAFTARGQTTVRPLAVRIDSPEDLFALKEMRDLVKEVRATPTNGFPTRVEVAFKNGDTLEIELTCTPSTAL